MPGLLPSHPSCDTASSPIGRFPPPSGPVDLDSPIEEETADGPLTTVDVPAVCAVEEGLSVWHMVGAADERNDGLENQPQLEAVAIEVLSFALDLVPVAGTAKAIAELIQGKDVITGADRNRVLLALAVAISVVPFGAFLLKNGSKLRMIRDLSDSSYLLERAAARIPDAQMRHIFRTAEGHVAVQPQYQERFVRLFEHVKNNPLNKNNWGLSETARRNGIERYRLQFGDRHQVWVDMRNGKISNAGINVPGDKYYFNG